MKSNKKIFVVCLITIFVCQSNRYKIDDNPIEDVQFYKWYITHCQDARIIHLIILLPGYMFRLINYSTGVNLIDRTSISILNQ